MKSWSGVRRDPRAGDHLARAVRLRGMTEAKSRAAVLTEISLIFAAVFWGLNFAATKYAAESIPPLFIVVRVYRDEGMSGEEISGRVGVLA